MLTEDKIKSYVLLMAYDFKRIKERSIAYIQNKSEDSETTKLSKDLLKYIDESNSKRIGLSNFNTNWEELLNFIKITIKISIKMPYVVQDYIFILLGVTGIFPFNKDPNEIVKDPVTITERITFLLNKYCHLKFFFLVIFDNYKDFKTHYENVNIGTAKFDEIILKKINKSGKHISSSQILKDFHLYFEDAQKKIGPTYCYIIDHLPFEFLKTIKTSNEKKINMFFKKKIALELKHYINLTNTEVYKRELFLGYCFGLVHLCLTEEEFIKIKVKKDKYYQEIHTYKKYTEYLRTEGHNILKSL